MSQELPQRELSLRMALDQSVRALIRAEKVVRVFGTTQEHNDIQKALRQGYDALGIREPLRKGLEPR